MEETATLLDNIRLAELEAAVRQAGVSVLSLDCFDTLLWRRVPKPADAFQLLGEELRERGALAGGMSAATFATMHIAAEQLARHRKLSQTGSHEINLGDVYTEFRGDITPLSVDELRAAELALERRITIADGPLAQTLSRLAAKLDLRVVFVSDMYLSERGDQLLIDHPEMADLAGAEVFSSADLGIGKENGLWQLLPERWRVAGRRRHVGNNPGADGVGAAGGGRPRRALVRAARTAGRDPGRRGLPRRRRCEGPRPLDQRRGPDRVARTGRIRRRRRRSRRPHRLGDRHVGARAGDDRLRRMGPAANGPARHHPGRFA